MNYPIIKSHSQRPYQICKCCVMDTTDEGVSGGQKGPIWGCGHFLGPFTNQCPRQVKLL